MNSALVLINRKLCRDVCNLVRGFAAVPFQAEIHALAEGKTEMPWAALVSRSARGSPSQRRAERVFLFHLNKKTGCRPREETRQTIRRFFERRRQPHDLAHMEEAAPP